MARTKKTEEPEVAPVDSAPDTGLTPIEVARLSYPDAWPAATNLGYVAEEETITVPRVEKVTTDIESKAADVDETSARHPSGGGSHLPYNPDPSRWPQGARPDEGSAPGDTQNDTADDSAVSGDEQAPEV